MPLMQSASSRAVGENIRREKQAGKPPHQALAIALDMQRRNRAGGGGTPGDLDDPALQSLVLLPHEMNLRAGDRRAIMAERLNRALIGPMTRRLQRKIDHAQQAAQALRDSWAPSPDWHTAVARAIRNPEPPDQAETARVNEMENSLVQSQMPQTFPSPEIGMARGGFPRAYDDGGAISSTAPPSYLGASPQIQQLYQRYATLPLDKLQQLAVMTPSTTPQGQMIQRAMRAKQMAPAANNAFSSLGSTAGAGGSPSLAPAQRRGGMVRALDSGGSSGGAGGSAPPTGVATNSGWQWNAAPSAGHPASGGMGLRPGPGAAANGVMTYPSASPARSSFVPAAGGNPMLPPSGDSSFSGGFPSYGGQSGFPSAGAASGNGYVRGAYGAMLPTMSFSAGNPGGVGPTWSPGQALLSPSSPITTTPPSFGGAAANPPIVTQLPASVLAAGNPPAAPPSQPIYIGGAGYKRGGTPQRACGGLGQGLEAMASVTPHRGMGEFYHPGGFIHSPVSGRTDHLPLAVPADSHVIPADVVSGLGQGNSLSGAHLLDDMFHSGPWGVKALKSRAPAPRVTGPQEMPHLAAGGSDRTTSILAAGGEYVVRPEAVEHFGVVAKRKDPGRFGRRSAIAVGHDLVDHFIVQARKNIVQTMKRLPGPVKN